MANLAERNRLGYFVKLSVWLGELYLLLFFIEGYPGTTASAVIAEGLDNDMVTPSSSGKQLFSALQEEARLLPSAATRPRSDAGDEDAHAPANVKGSAREVAKKEDDPYSSLMRSDDGMPLPSAGTLYEGESSAEQKTRSRMLAGYGYPGLGGGYYGAYLSWYRNVYIPWYYATYGMAVTPPLMTSPVVYNTYTSGIMPVATAAAPGMVIPVTTAAVQTPAVAASPVVAAPTYTASLAPSVVPGNSNSAFPNTREQPSEALLSLQDDSDYQMRNNGVSGTPTAILAPQGYGAAGYSPNGMNNTPYASRRRQGTSGGGLGGLGLMNFAAFLARPDGTLAAIGGNGQ